MLTTKSQFVGKPFVCPEESLFQTLVQTATVHANRPALIFYGQTVTYQQLVADVEQVSAFIYSQGIRKGDPVALMLPNCPQYVIAYYACMRLGAVVVQVNPLYTAPEVAYTLKDSGAQMLVTLDRIYEGLTTTESVQELGSVVVVSLGAPQDTELPATVSKWGEVLNNFYPLPEAAEIDPAEDVAVLQYTGGTTGRSKGAMLTHRNLIANTWQTVDVIGRENITEQDRVLTAIPLFHVYAMTVAMNVALFRGASLILLPRFELLEVLETIKLHRPTLFPGVPTMYVAIANHPQVGDYGIDSIRICNSGSAPLPVEVMNLFEEKTGGKILEGFGLTEAAPVTHSNPYVGSRKPGSIGQPTPGTEAGIVDLGSGKTLVEVGKVGELVVRGPQVMKGYWNAPHETANSVRNEGWLYTGDIAYMDKDGFFYIIDRKKDMIISSGSNVYPREVEEVLYQHPAVQEAVVVGVPDSYRGETVKAFVVLKSDAIREHVEWQLDEWCRTRLAAYKVPRRYELRDELPKTAVGKILRRVLREQ